MELPLLAQRSVEPQVAERVPSLFQKSLAFPPGEEAFLFNQSLLIPIQRPNLGASQNNIDW